MTSAPSTVAARGASPGRPARTVTAALFVDFGESRGGQWIRHPRAKYECVRCRTTEGPVHGADAVTAFTAGIRTAHRTRCTAPQEHVRE